MDRDDPRSPYHRQVDYQKHAAFDRPRPASARDLGYEEMYDSGIHGHSTSPRVPHQYGDNLGSGMATLNPRASSLDRQQGGDPYGMLRGAYDMTTPKPVGARQGYAMKSLNSNPGSLSAILGQQGGQPHRRAHSYDMNLEKQGLAEYNTLLAAAGVGGNPMMYANPTTQLLDYSGLTAPSIPSLGAIDYGSLQRAAAFPAGYPVTGAGLFNLQGMPDVTVLQRECFRLQHELEIVKEKLNACTTSIRTFWSPELKRERSMRKEENAKYAILADHLHQLQLEKQTMLETLHNMESDLRRERDFRIRGRFSSDRESEGLSELDMSKRQIDELTVENRQMKKAMEESDRRTNNAKASLTATEESLRRLVEAVKAGKGAAAAAASTPAGTGNVEAGTGAITGTATGATSEVGAAANIRLDRIEADRAEITRLRNQLNEACSRGSEAERQLIERNYEFSQMKEEFNLLLQDHQRLKQENDGLRQETRQSQTLQSLVDTKESKIMTLENEIRLLEDEISRLRDDELITPNTSTSSGIDDLDKTLQAFRSNERVLKAKVEMLNGEISKRDCEIYALQSRLEMTDKQHQDQMHHITVLKEQVKTREHKISMLTADTEDFRKRLKEKETQLEKKTKSLSTTQGSKRQIETDLSELKDQVDIRERKLSLMQRKIENLEDILNDRESQLAASRVRLTQLGASRVAVDGQHPEMDETPIDRSRDQQARAHSDSTDELEAQRRLITELRGRMEVMQRELDDRATQLLELREELSELRSCRFKNDAELSQLQAQLNQRASEVATLQMEKQIQHKQISTECEMKYGQRIGELEGQVNHYMETTSKLQSEIDRLVRNMENEKFEHEKHMREVQEELRETQNNLSNLKRTHQTERKKNTQLLEETRQREVNAQSDIEILKGIMSEKDARVRDLEQALRESVRLTAEREIYASGRDDESRHLEQQARDLRSNVEQLQRERNNLSAQMANIQEELSDREGQLKTLEQECFQNYLPELEKLRRSNHEANLRVAAMVKLTQGREHSLTDQDRAVLSSIPLFPSLGTTTGWHGMGMTGATSTSRLYVPPGYHMSTGAGGGGATSPHLAGSAFQLFGNSGMPQMTSGRASAPGQSMASPDVVMLTRMLQDKESSLQQHLQELTHLRFQNSELDIRLKAMQRELDTKTTRLGILEAAQLSTSSRLDPGLRSPTGMTDDVSHLRRAHQELTVRFSKLQLELDDRERQLRAMDRMNTSVGSRHGNDFSEMAVLRRELVTLKAEKETEAMSLTKQLEDARRGRIDMGAELKEVQATLSEKANQVRLIESEKDKHLMDRESLQKKYEAVLTQLGEKTDKLRDLEITCQKDHVETLNRQKTELDDLRHHATYVQNCIQERENRIEVVEKESYKVRDEIATIRKQLNTNEVEVKSLREEVTYREERLRQLQTQHTDELSRLRSANQEQVTRSSHLEMKLDEKEHELKSQGSELRCKADELTRLQSSLEDVNNRLTISQKRVEEREMRLRKLENENHDLLDEIHCLRKGNTELESQFDCLRQQLLDRGDRPGSAVPPSAITSPPMRYHKMNSFGGTSTYANQELDRLRSQHGQLTTTHEETDKQLKDLQIQYDQMTVQRNNLRTQLEEEMSKHAKAEAKLREKEEELRARILDIDKSEQSLRSSTQVSDLRNELERKDAQISCLKYELERAQSSSHIARDRISDTTSDKLHVTDLQVMIRQVTEERDEARDKLAAAIACSGTASLDIQQQMMVEKQTLHDQIANLTQTAHNAAAEAERYQRESRQASSRVQQMSRQLQETQSNCDAIARERDNIRDQLDQLKRTGRSGVSAMSSVANLFGATGTGAYGTSGIGGGVGGGGGGGGMRPASAGPGSYENIGSYLHGGTTSHLSRELDRLHREHELCQGQMRTVQQTEQASREEAEKLREELTKLREELEKQRKRIEEVTEQKTILQHEMSKHQMEEQERAQFQHNEMNEKLKWSQQQHSEKNNQVESITNELNTTRQYCNELEQRINDMTQRLGNAESQTQQQRNEMQNYQQIQNQCHMLQADLKLKESEMQRLSMQVDQLTREYQNQERNMEQMAIELTTAQAQTAQHKREAQQALEQVPSRRASVQSISKESEQMIQMLQEEVRDSNSSKQELEQELHAMQMGVQSVREQLDEKARLIDVLENQQLVQQQEEISILNKELQAARVQIENLGGSSQSSPSNKGSPLKLEIDTLKREIGKRDDAIGRLEKECQERHVRRIEAMQVQLRRFEEEATNLNKVLDEQRAGLDERDRLIRQLRSNQGQASNVELEKLRNEHARCKDQFEQHNKRINTMVNQIESQSDEILSIKLEALTASLCEKGANIALMELTAPKNAASSKAMEKLCTERDQLQTQHKQLANTRAMLEEERKSRR